MEVQGIADRLGYGTHRVVCPLCSPERKKKNLKDLVITKDDDGFVYFCHHCGASDGQRTVRFMPAKTLQRDPVSSPELLTERKISEATAKRCGVYQTRAYFQRLQRETEALAFPYLSPNEGNEYAAKLRSIEGKDFSCNGAPQTLFNINNVADPSTLIICEGEIDALSLVEVGIDATSIPNGAFTATPRDGSAALRYLEHHSDLISKASKVILFLDDDKPGRITAEELARRIGRSKCWSVKHPDGCKDANDILVKWGPEALRDTVAKAEPWPVEGLNGLSTYQADVMDIWANGVEKGRSTGFQNVDQIYSVLPGQLSIVTGHPGSGKSEFVDQIMVNLAESEGWRFAICSFENEPRLHITKLVQKYIGLPFLQGPTRMSEKQRDAGLHFVRKHFSFLHDTGGDLTSLDSIIDRLKAAVLRYGIKGAVIDPYNYIARPRDMSETEWVSQMLSRIRSFAQAHGVHVWFIAHPAKMIPGQGGDLRIPKGNDISGSAAWWAKADMGVTVHRPEPDKSTTAEIHVWKVRFAWAGRQGSCELYFSESAGQLVQPGCVARVRKVP